MHLDGIRRADGSGHADLGPRGLQYRVVGEDLLVQAAQLRPRLDTQFVGEGAAQLVERRERRLLTSGRVERAQPALPERLAVGVLGEQGDQVRDDPVRIPGGQQGVEAVLLQRHAHLGEPGADRFQPSGVRDAVVGRAAPAAQRVVGDPQRLDRVGGAPGAAAAAIRTCESIMSGVAASR